MKSSHLLSLITYTIAVVICSVFYLQKQEVVYYQENLQDNLEKITAKVADQNNQITELRRELYATNNDLAFATKPTISSSYPQVTNTVYSNADIFLSDYLYQKPVFIDSFRYKQDSILRKGLGGIMSSQGLSYYVSITSYPTDQYVLRNIVQTPKEHAPISPLIPNSMFSIEPTNQVRLRYAKYPQFITDANLRFYQDPTDVEPSIKTLLIQPTPNGLFHEMSISHQSVPGTQPKATDISQGLKEIANSITIVLHQPNL